MLKALPSWVIICFFLVSISAADTGFPPCNCDEEGFWSIESILVCQKVSDFLIAVAYFSIPIELLYFVSCSNVPFKWVLFQFIAFIVLCGMTHLLNGWTYGPHPFQLMLSLTIFKILTALVSVATAITLITLIPLLLKVKVREFMLRKKTWDLGREVGIIMKQREAGLHVRMLTREIRKSLDRHTILYTTLVELSKALDLQNCAVWMPNENRTEMHLTHELKGKDFPNMPNLPIPVSEPDVREIKTNDGVKLLDPDSPLAAASSGGTAEWGAVAAIRMPMLRICNFKGGTPENFQACYAILVLVLPGGQGRYWSDQEIEIVMVVADQVAVALSHAAVLEESQLMRDKLVEQNRALQQAREEALMASQARNAFQSVMSDGLSRPMHSISFLLSMMQDNNLSSEQRLIIDTLVKTSNVLSILINDVMDNPTKSGGRFPLEMRSFELHSTIRQAACLAKCLCVYNGYIFSIEVDKSLPNHVMGDERRVLQVILHMVGKLLSENTQGGIFSFRIYSTSGSQGKKDQRWGPWRSELSERNVCIRFEIGVSNKGFRKESSSSAMAYPYQRNCSGGVDESLSFSVCRKLAQLMQGSILVVQHPEDFDQSMALLLHFQIRPSIVVGISDHEHSYSDSLFRGLEILVADNDDVHRAVTRKLLQNLGCTVSAVTSGYECLSAVPRADSTFQIVLLDLHLPDIDGFEVTSRIRKVHGHSWPLIIALTANDVADVWGRCLQIGMNGVIQKPVLLQGITNELRRVLLQSNRVLSWC